VRPLLVVLRDERVEPRLLLQHVRGGWLGGVFLQREVHALVAAVLLRVAGLDPLELDAQREPILTLELPQAETKRLA
jgi:hypothetical protein